MQRCMAERKVNTGTLALYQPRPSETGCNKRADCRDPFLRQPPCAECGKRNRFPPLQGIPENLRPLAAMALADHARAVADPRRHGVESAHTREPRHARRRRTQPASFDLVTTEAIFSSPKRAQVSAKFSAVTPPVSSWCLASAAHSASVGRLTFICTQDVSTALDLASAT
jgi:hypothetical protein